MSKQNCGVSHLVYAAIPSTGRSRPKSDATPSMASLIAAQTRYSLIRMGLARFVNWLKQIAFRQPQRVTDLSFAIVAFRSADKGG